ncbi:MAG: hypothetical protein IJP62_01060 [Treponema sp.]|nr:hypothetical protein [Treponema sp.]
MRKTGLFLLMTATLILSGVFLACSNDGDSENESQKTEYTVTLYTEFGANPTTEGAGTATVTTTTNEVGADSYQSEKTVAVTTNENGTKVTVTTESSSKTNADGSKTETESKTTENFDGTNTTVTSEKTVTTKNADGKTTSKVETTVAADGTTTITTTDADGKTTTETTGGSGEKLEVTLNETGYPDFEIAIPQDDDICIANYYSYEDSISAGASWSLRCGRIYAGAFPGTLKTVNLPLTVHWYGAPYDTSTLSWPDNCNTEISFSSDGEGNKEKLRQAICISMKEGQQIK